MSMPFKPFATELCFAGEISMWGTRIVISDVLTNQTLNLAHKGYPGMTLMKQIKNKGMMAKDVHTGGSVWQKLSWFHFRGCINSAGSNKTKKIAFRTVATSDHWFLGSVAIGSLFACFGSIITADTSTSRDHDKNQFVGNHKKIGSYVCEIWSVDIDHGR